MPRRSAPVVCNEEDRKALERLSLSSDNPRLAKRAAMVLDFIDGTTITDIAEKYSERQDTVIKWKRRFAEQGISGLRNLPRGKTGSKYGEEFIGRLVQAVNSPPPDGKPAWTVELLATHLDVPRSAVKRYLRKEGISLTLLKRPRTGTSEVQNALKAPNLSDVIPMDTQEDPLNTEPHQLQEGTTESRTDVTPSAGGNSAGRNSMTEGKENIIPVHQEAEPGRLGLQITFSLVDSNGNIVREGSTLAPSAVADAKTFDMDSVAGFRHDFGEYEKALFSSFVELAEAFSSDFLNEYSKKKKN